MNKGCIHTAVYNKNPCVILNPTHFQSVTVENLQNERKIPYTNGTINPIVNAAIVGKAKIQNFFLIDFSITNIPFLKNMG